MGSEASVVRSTDFAMVGAGSEGMDPASLNHLGYGSKRQIAKR